MAWDRAQRPAGRPGHRVAGPPLQRHLRRTRARTPSAWRSLTGLGARPVLRRTEDRLAARPGGARADDHHHRHLAAAPAVRRLRHRRRHRRSLAAARSRHRRVERRSLRDLRHRPRARLPQVVGNAVPLGECTTFGGSVPVTGACVDQQAALFAEACHTAGEAKCTYGTGAFMLACTGIVPDPFDERARRLPGLAARWRADLVPRRAGVHGRRGGELADRHGHHAIDPATSIALGGAVRRRGGRHVRAGARRAGRAVLEAERQGRVHRAVAGHRARASGARRHRRHRRAGCACWHTPPVATSALRSHACASTVASRAATRCCRCRPICCSARSRSTPRRTPPRWASLQFAAIGAGQPLPADAWRPSAVVEPSISADEASRAVGAWQAAPTQRWTCSADGPDVRRRRRRRWRGRLRRRSRAEQAATFASRWSRPATTSAQAPARPTPRSCTPGSTPRPARSSHGWSPAATNCCGPTPPPSGISIEETGAVLVAWDDEQAANLPRLAREGRGQRLPPRRGHRRCDSARAGAASR